MKPTVKISIGGRAFNLEEDAYQVLDNYLRSLRRHFMGNPEADEIIGDIETRLSELLQMRVNNNEGVVSLDDAREITRIMGNPKDFDDNVTEESYLSDNRQRANGRSHYSDSFKKKLYRDMDNKIIGGVCSGLGHYFRVDPTAIRLIFAGVFLLFFFAMHWGPVCTTILLVYIVLWIVMPSAGTFKQKLEMTGEDPSIENIEDRTQSPQRKYKGTSVSTVLGVIINIIVGFVAVITFVTMIFIIAFMVWLYFDTEVVGLTNYLVLLGFNTWNFKIALLLMLVIPIGGVFSLMVKILRRSPFTTQTLVCFIVALVFWLGSIFYLGNKGFKFGHSHQDSEIVVENTIVDTGSDILYVNLGNEYLNAEPQPNNPAMLYKGNRIEEREICLLPPITIREDTTLAGYKIDIYKKGFGRNNIMAKRKAETLNFDYTVSDSLVTINPKWYSNDNSWNAEVFKVVITKPRGKEVRLDYPLKKSYNTNNIRINIYEHSFDLYDNFY